MSKGYNKSWIPNQPVKLRKETMERSITIKWKGRDITITGQALHSDLCPGAGDSDVIRFLDFIETTGLNPYMKEIYFTPGKGGKYDIITAKETFLKRAALDPAYEGFQTSFIEDKEGAVIGCECVVYVKGRQPLNHPVYIDEYQKKSAPDKAKTIWEEKPRTMIRKVAIVGAHREAFPDLLGGMYDADEMTHLPDSSSIDLKPVDYSTPPTCAKNAQVDDSPKKDAPKISIALDASLSAIAKMAAATTIRDLSRLHNVDFRDNPEMQKKCMLRIQEIQKQEQAKEDATIEWKTMD